MDLFYLAQQVAKNWASSVWDKVEGNLESVFIKNYSEIHFKYTYVFNIVEVIQAQS